MGNACGIPASGRERAPEPSALDALIRDKVKDYTRRHPVEASKTVNQIAMKFPSMLSSFEALRGIFDRVDKDANGFIEKHEFVTAVEEGFSRKVTVEREMIERIYDEADLKHDGRVNYKEFVLMIVLLYLVRCVASRCVDAARRLKIFPMCFSSTRHPHVCHVIIL